MNAGIVEVMERNRQSMEQIFEDNGGEEAVIDADDTGMVSQQRVAVESEIAEEGPEADVEGGEDDLT